MNPRSFASARLLRDQNRVVRRWHQVESRLHSWEDACRWIPLPDGEPLSLAAAVARINTFQWHEEDKVRAVGAPDPLIAAIKRSIDQSNQRRVETIEKLDLFLEEWLARDGQRLRKRASLSSETPGSIVDRVSILSLKIYHMEQEASRPKLGAKQRMKLRGRLKVLREQKTDLSGCLDALWRDLLAGRRRFKTYFQFKMYNDPQTNPYLRGRGSRSRWMLTPS